MRTFAILNPMQRNGWNLISPWPAHGSLLNLQQNDVLKQPSCSNHQLKCSSQTDHQAAVLPASQTHWGQNIGPRGWLGLSQDCPAALHIFREIPEGWWDVPRTSMCPMPSWRLECLGQKIPQLSLQRRLSSRNASRLHKWPSRWTLLLISFA